MFPDKFTWNSSEEHDLLIPLQNIRPAARIRKAEVETLDFSAREVVIFGKVYEALAEIAYDEAPQSLIDLAIAGAEWTTITHDDGTTQTELFLLFPGEVVEIDVNRQNDMRPLKMYNLPVRLRKTDGTAFGSSFFEAL